MSGVHDPAPNPSGSFIVIPTAHTDHFTDLPDDLAAHLLTISQRYGRGLLHLPDVERVGYVVYGFGVPHAHLNVVPQHDALDIVSSQFVVAEGGFSVSEAHIPMPTRDELGKMAAVIAARAQT